MVLIIVADCNLKLCNCFDYLRKQMKMNRNYWTVKLILNGHALAYLRKISSMAKSHLISLDLVLTLQKT